MYNKFQLPVLSGSSSGSTGQREGPGGGMVSAALISLKSPFSNPGYHRRGQLAHPPPGAASDDPDTYQGLQLSQYYP